MPGDACQLLGVFVSTHVNQELSVEGRCVIEAWVDGKAWSSRYVVFP
jgi:hypothetical protein